MIIDLCGFSGSGKTTIHGHLKKQYIAAGYHVVPFRDFLHNTYIPKKTSKYLSSNPGRRVINLLAQFRFQNPELMQVVDTISAFEYEEYNLLSEVFAAYISILEQNDPKLIVIIDEGFVHRLSVLFRRYAHKHLNVADDSEARQESLMAYADMIGLLPDFGATVLLNVSAEESRERAFARKVKHQQESKRGEVRVTRESFFKNYPDIKLLEYQYELYQIAVSTFDKRKMQSVVVGEQVTPKIAAEYIFNMVDVKAHAPKGKSAGKAGPSKPTSAKGGDKLSAKRQALAEAKRLAKLEAELLEDGNFGGDLK